MNQWYRPFKRKALQYNSCIYQPRGWGRPCRFVAMRILKEQNQALNQPQQCVLFEDDKYTYRIFCTSLAGAAHKVIAIDAGHGGEDPGAIGRRGTHEKDVVLSIARKLAALIETEPGMRPVMIRNGDYYIGLRQRIDKARKQGADMFISIHADAFKDRRAHGSSVFVLSRRGASSEMARWLARKENAADLAGRVSLDDKDDVLAEVLLDLSQTATIEASVVTISVKKIDSRKP